MHPVLLCNFLDKSFLAEAIYVKKLGDGGGGVVNLIRVKDKEWALKLLIPYNDKNNFSHSSTIFYEVDSLIRFKGIPGVIQVKGICWSHSNHKEVLAIVMEKMEGNLQEFYKKEKDNTLNYFNDFFDQIIGVIALFEKIKLTHYDIKPQNILYQTDGDQIKFKITDFGLAVVGQKRINDVFTLWYRPPEYMMPTEYILNSAAGDIWAFGLTCLEMIIRKPIITGNTPRDVLVNIIKISEITAETQVTEFNMGQYLNQGGLDVWKILKTNLSEEEFNSLDVNKINMIVQMLRWDPNQRIKASEILAQKKSYQGFIPVSKIGAQLLEKVKMYWSVDQNNNYYLVSTKEAIDNFYIKKMIGLDWPHQAENTGINLIKAIGNFGNNKIYNFGQILMAIEIYTRFVAKTKKIKIDYAIASAQISWFFFNDFSYNTARFLAITFKTTGVNLSILKIYEAEKEILSNLDFHIYNIRLTPLLNRKDINLLEVNNKEFEKPVDSWFL